MIRDEDIEKALEAGRIASKALMHARSLTRKDSKLLDIAVSTEAFIIDKGAYPAFPMQISIGSIAAHDAASFEDERIIRSNDLVKLDVGVHVDGVIADNALTVDMSGKHSSITRASMMALEFAVKNIRKDVAIRDISLGISESIESFGMKPISNLSGHGLGKYKIHAEPQIPNIPFQGAQKIMPHSHIAVEPFSTNGYGKVVDTKDAEVFCHVKAGNVRDSIARKALGIIRGYKMLPFSLRWIAEKMGEQRAEYALNVLMASKIITSYPKLKEVQDGLVAQHERTFIITDDDTIITTRWDME